MGKVVYLDVYDNNVKGSLYLNFRPFSFDWLFTSPQLKGILFEVCLTIHEHFIDLSMISSPLLHMTEDECLCLR
jgi:hypothetical protein